MQPKEFRKYLLDRFGLELPENIVLSRGVGSSIRIYTQTLNNFPIKTLRIKAYRGFIVYSKKTGISNEFIQLFGKNAKKNVFDLEEAEARSFAAGKKIEKRLRALKGPVILRFRGHIIGLAMFDGRYLFPKIKSKRRRKIENSIRAL